MDLAKVVRHAVRAFQFYSSSPGSTYFFSVSDENFFPLNIFPTTMLRVSILGFGLGLRILHNES
jgi:hypothetical protein